MILFLSKLIGLDDHLQSYRCRRYHDLVKLVGDTQVAEVQGPSGIDYQIEVEVIWDQHPGGNIRVLGAIDDGSLRGAFAPVCDDFALTPDVALP